MLCWCSSRCFHIFRCLDTTPRTPATPSKMTSVSSECHQTNLSNGPTQIPSTNITYVVQRDEQDNFIEDGTGASTLGLDKQSCHSTCSSHFYMLKPRQWMFKLGPCQRTCYARFRGNSTAILTASCLTFGLCMRMASSLVQLFFAVVHTSWDWHLHHHHCRELMRSEAAYVFNFGF